MNSTQSSPSSWINRTVHATHAHRPQPPRRGRTNYLKRCGGFVPPQASVIEQSTFDLGGDGPSIIELIPSRHSHQDLPPRARVQSVSTFARECHQPPSKGTPAMPRHPHPLASSRATQARAIAISAARWRSSRAAQIAIRFSSIGSSWVPHWTPRSEESSKSHGSCSLFESLFAHSQSPTLAVGFFR